MEGGGVFWTQEGICTYKLMVVSQTYANSIQNELQYREGVGYGVPPPDEKQLTILRC